MIEFSPFSKRQFILKPVSVLLCFPRQQKKSSWNEGLLLWAAWAQLRGTRASLHAMEGVKRTLFNWTKQDKMCKFLRESSFSSYVQHKNRKNKQLIQLILCQLDAWRLVEGKGRKTDSCFVQLKSILLISCVFWIFFQNTGSQLCGNFLFVCFELVFSAKSDWFFFFRKVEDKKDSFSRNMGDCQVCMPRESPWQQLINQ